MRYCHFLNICDIIKSKFDYFCDEGIISLARKPADQSVNRETILHAAADVLRRNGYEATTMKDIASEVNLTAASLYHHFRNKDALLLAVLEGGLDHAISKIEPVVQSDKTSTEKLYDMVRLHVLTLTANTAVGAAMIFEIRPLMNLKADGRNGAHNYTDDFITKRDTFFQRREYFEVLFRQVVKEGIEKGEFREVDIPIYTKSIIGANNWVAVWYKEGGRLSGEEIAQLIADGAIRAIKCD